MKALKLIRQRKDAPDFAQLDAMKGALEALLYSDYSHWEKRRREAVEKLLSFQHEDGSFTLLDSYRIPSDARVDYCHEPTYICTAILMRALLDEESILAGREEAVLGKALRMCCARGLQGSGLSEFRAYLKAVGYFVQGGVRDFLLLYPALCPEFTAMFRGIGGAFRDMARQDRAARPGESSAEAEEIRRSADYFSKSNLFVYGTLMSGQANHEAYLADSRLLGHGEIRPFTMYDLGHYPGIVPGGGTLRGELYEIDEGTRAALDQLEGEGSLFLRRALRVRLTEGGRTMVAESYIFNGDVAGCPRIAGRYAESEKAEDAGDEEDRVWYVSYGSNLLRERFRCYIEGGLCTYNERKYTPCRDARMPEEDRPVMIPHDMYYANRSGSWQGSAVSFLDLSRPGRAYGRAYKIRRAQLADIHKKEGKGQDWYDACVRLADIDGLPAYTFTNEAGRRPESLKCVSEAYRSVLEEGLRESYPGLSEGEITAYLEACGKRALEQS